MAGFQLLHFLWCVEPPFLFFSLLLIKPSFVTPTVIPYCDTESSGIVHKRGKASPILYSHV